MTPVDPDERQDELEAEAADLRAQAADLEAQAAHKDAEAAHLEVGQADAADDTGDEGS